LRSALGINILDKKYVLEEIFRVNW